MKTKPEIVSEKKTLGQIAEDAFAAFPETRYVSTTEQCWQAAALAVRDETIEKFAFKIDCLDAQTQIDETNYNAGKSPEYNRGWRAGLIAASELVRSLKEKQE